ncbi:MAG: hypothetical protein IKQ56_04295 [Lachnospiraceae bacterium]|nr:hypothetical protein [Lachnospiraceae bacterium]
MVNETRQYKNDVFCMLMEYPEYALQIYNGLNNTDYTDPSVVEIKTIESGVSLTVHNDAAFVVNSDLNIFEHQSTVCPNMPLRSMLYYATIIRAEIKNRDLYSRKLVKIQKPNFVVFYNGNENQPEKYDLRLSDAFERQVENPDMELVCHVYNINAGNNTDLMDKCSVLKGYMTFVDLVRDNISEGKEVRDAVKTGLDICIEQGILTEFFTKRYDEVMKVVELDYTFERRIELQREESYLDGRNDGLKEGETSKLIDQIVKKILKNKPIPVIASELETDESEITRIYTIVEKYSPEYDTEKILAELKEKEQD